jgi:hypothetical protein
MLFAIALTQEVWRGRLVQSRRAHLQRQRCFTRWAKG